MNPSPNAFLPVEGDSLFERHPLHYSSAIHKKPVHVHDFHATIRHLMGFVHEKLTYRNAGRYYRLTEVEGHVVKEVIA